MPAKRRRAPKKSSKKKAVAQEEEGWYSIRRILDQKVVRGRVQYLVDWDDNIVTGEKYTPTWSDDVTAVAKEEWEQRKAQEALPEIDNPQSDPASVEESDDDDDQPPRPANWRQLSRSHASTLTRRRRSLSTSSLASERPRKIPRTDSGKIPSEEPGLDYGLSSSIGTPSETHDLPDQEVADPHKAASVVVEIPKDPDFDPTEYLSVTNSQESGHSSQSVAELETEDSIIAFLLVSQGTVPDSQDLSDQSWSHLHSLERPTSAAESAQNQIQISQPSPSARVIPDSHEHIHSSAPSSSAAALVRQLSPTLSNQGSPRPSQRDIVTQFGIEQSDIPSHQPDHKGAAVGTVVPEPSEVTSHPPSVAHPASRSSVSPRRVVQETTQSTTSPKYLTQPSIPFSFSLPESSVDSQAVGSPYPSITEAASPGDHQKGAPLDSRESQDAQIVPPVLDSVEKPPTDSDLQDFVSEPDTDETESADASRERTPEEPQTEDRFQSITPAIQRALQEALDEAYSSSPCSKFRPSPAKSQIMDEKSASGSAPRRSMSAVEELTQLFAFDPEPEPVAQPTNEALPVPAGTVSENASHINPHAEIPIHSSLNLGVRPIGIEATSWVVDDATGSNQESVLEAIVPASIMSQPPQSATEALLNMVDMSFSTSSNLVPDSLVPDRVQELPLATVSLADISRQVEPTHRGIPLMPSLLSQEPVSSKLYETSGASLQMGQAQIEHDSPESISHQDLILEHTVTLPFQASLRPLYDDTVMEYKRPITDFGNIFSSEIYVEPDESLVNKIDELFGRLHNICDYPQNLPGTSLEELPPTQIAKYCCDANSKFSFVFELLQGLQKDTRILIVARSPELLRLIHHLTVPLEVECTCDVIGKSNSNFADSVARVVLALPTEEIELSAFDLVIGFDSSFLTSEFTLRSSSQKSSSKQQLFLSLVMTHSIEHIGLQVSEEVRDLSPVERKNVLLSAIVRARQLLSDPDRDYLEPHEVAAVFCEYLNGQVDAISWEPLTVPDDVLDVFLNTQNRSQVPMVPQQEPENGRKRKLDDSDGSEVKRMRILSAQESTADGNQLPLPDEVRELIEAAARKQKSSRPEVLVRVSLSVLEVLAEQVSEYERRLDDANLDIEYKAVIANLEKRVKEYERTSRKVYASNRSALQDRSRFEVEKLKAEANLKAATEAAELEAGKYKTRITQLEETVVRLTRDPNSSDPQNTPLAKSEKLLQETLAKVGVLEKRLVNANQDESYVRNAYQDASSSVTTMRSEITSLKAQNEELLKKASENSVLIHQVQEQNTAGTYLRQIEELRAQMRERETELDRAREELRQLKNGRRETRGVSVPRSPRMGMMSPRTGRGYGSASRGTSPAPGAGVEGTGMQFIGQQPNNPRWNHLRD
ncbi:hypothetical protein PT974_06813 [Cladobotryum mycophilum]|uniref:Chromo domain-containing protein n=1 Tax=Cladobotryum mycophilum TaxID=491253 RepID=A0ABR0SMQ3_9HYPO